MLIFQNVELIGCQMEEEEIECLFSTGLFSEVKVSKINLNGSYRYILHFGTGILGTFPEEISEYLEGKKVRIIGFELKIDLEKGIVVPIVGLLVED